MFLQASGNSFPMFGCMYTNISKAIYIYLSSGFVKFQLPEDIVKDFSEVEALEFDQMNNKVTIIRKNCGPEVTNTYICNVFLSTQL